MTESSLYLNQIEMLEKEVRTKTQAALEGSRDLAAKHQIDSVLGHRRPYWQTVVRALNIQIDLMDIDRYQVKLLALLAWQRCECPAPEESRRAAAKLDECLQVLNELLEVAQNGPPLAYRLWKDRLCSIRKKTEEIDHVAETLRAGSRRFASGGPGK